ncbi:MAG TPA: SH3 domain-containing protein [Candidatus Binatia bacterium]|nr:SH3 domain-containing protein [Candidatus Binatia bacterium]
MKQCPECSTEYEDSVNFCAKDGRSLVAKIVTRSRLCPQCANSVAENASQCPYCKADLTSSPMQQWPARSSRGSETIAAGPTGKSLRTAKAVLIAGIILSVIGILLIGRSMLGRDRSESQLLLAEKIKELEAKEQKIQTLETQLAKVREDLAAGSNQLADLKDKLDQSRKELASPRQKSASVPREVDRQAASRAESLARSEPRPADPAPSAPPRRPAEPGVYETIRATTVYEEPSNGSRVISQIGQGTRVTVVRSVGDWLEVRSKHGKPPGFIRREDAMFTSGAN